MNGLRLWLRSIVTGVGMAILYGVVHDQITIRISPPYLLDWHPTLFPTRDLTTVALIWGIVATWWFGLILGGVLAAAATIGRSPKAPWRWIFQAMLGTFAFAAAAATVAGVVARLLQIELPGFFFGETYTSLPPYSRLAFSQAAVIHETSYWAAGLATFAGAASIVWRRRQAVKTSTSDYPRPDANLG